MATKFIVWDRVSLSVMGSGGVPYIYDTSLAASTASIRPDRHNGQKAAGSASRDVLSVTVP